MRQLTRREALVAGAAAVGGAGVGALASRSGRRPRVVVVGAGLAGLVAAGRLERAGADVLVLEARERVGGRVHTIRGFAGDQHAEAGGEFVDVAHTAVRAEVRRSGLRLEDLRAEPDRRAIAWRAGRPEDAGAATARVQPEIDRFWARIDALSARLDPASPLPAGAPLDGRSVASLFDELRLSPLARFLLAANLRDDYTAEPERLSLLFVCQTEAAEPAQPASGVEAFRIAGGNAQLPRALAHGLRRAPQLGSPVDRVEHGPGGVVVRARGERHAADWCVLACPLPPLRRVAFSPPLTPELAAAIAHTGYGTGRKTLLAYPTRFWSQRGDSGELQSDLPISSSWEATDAQPGRTGILIGYTMGAAGERAEQTSASAWASRAAADVARVWPGSPPPLRVVEARWADEPYTGGTYAAYAPGEFVRHWRAVRRAHGRLVLAGEHTATLTGYMESALRSGVRAAGRIRA